MTPMRDLVTALAARAEPALISVTADGARLELTGAVLANWVHKSVGLLGELDVGPDTALGIVCPAPAALHWRALAAALAAWALDAPVHLLTRDSPEPDEPWVALRPETLPGTGSRIDDSAAEDVLVFATAALALRSETEPGCTDFIAAVRAHPDVAPLGGPASAVLVGADGRSATVPLDAAALAAAAEGAGGDAAGGPGPRVLLAGLPEAAEIPLLLAALRTGVLVLTDTDDPVRLSELGRLDGVVHGTIGAWTK